METLSLAHVILYLLVGVASGLAAGLMGVGGGLVNVPGLYYGFRLAGYPTEHCFKMALGTSLAIIVITSASSARTHRNNGNLIPRVSLIAGFWGIAGAFAASLTAINLSDSILKKAFAILLLLAAYKIFTRKKKESEGANEMQTQWWRLAIIGIASGILAGFFGIGGGLMGVPLFMLWARIPPHKAVGSSAGMVVILAAFGALGYLISSPGVLLPYSLGYVNFPAWISVACSSIIAAHFGAVLAAKSSPKVLSIIFGIGLLAVAAKMIFS